MKNRSFFWGTFFILAAALIILNALDLLIGVSLVSLIITLLLIPLIVKSVRYASFSGILFPLAVIAILFSEQLGIEKLTPWPVLGIALFLSIGLSLLFPKKYKWYKKYNDAHVIPANEFGSGNSEVSDGSEINIEAKFSGCIRYINSDCLKKVNVNSRFAGVKLYFDNAVIDGSSAELDLNTDFAGVVIYVPKTWTVINKVDFSMGGMEEKGVRIQGGEEKTLIVKGRISFGGLTVHYI
ncbi:hypothetical protein [Ruminococcus sp. Marseille-P6503]|uniref:LiaF transmembrane domain-containing protein n=1 Tax=Ruminococcus sp. Marseille-P6503 TaxID=2364796 RepID=UPI000F52D5BB|nr:hypothetical protein [Ruminococcus sp. Marseille-P6503]